jgi:sporulation protein YlmC with PRC-barrel domain
MNKKLIALAAVFVFGLGFAVAQSHAARMMGKGRYTAYEVRSLLGAEVENPIGEPVGSIQDFVIDSNGHIDFAVLTYNFPWEYVPVPPQTIAVPFSAVKVKPDGNVAVLKFSGWKLELAPKFAKSDINNRQWTESDYRYFGQSPYWTEKGYAGSKDPYRWGGEAQDF